jgi:hypothetical protein
MIHVYVDVDGVINAVQLGVPIWEPTGERYERVRVNGFEITYATAVVRWLNALAARPDVAMHWLTTWEHDAPKLLAPAIGIDGADWPVVGAEDRYSKELAGGWWKLQALRDHLAADSADLVLWLDDDIKFDTSARQWLDHSPNVHWVSPDTFHGISPESLAAVDAWMGAAS